MQLAERILRGRKHQVLITKDFEQVVKENMASEGNSQYTYSRLCLTWYLAWISNVLISYIVLFKKLQSMSI